MHIIAGLPFRCAHRLSLERASISVRHISSRLEMCGRHDPGANYIPLNNIRLRIRIRQKDRSQMYIRGDPCDLGSGAKNRGSPQKWVPPPETKSWLRPCAKHRYLIRYIWQLGLGNRRQTVVTKKSYLYFKIFAICPTVSSIP